MSNPVYNALLISTASVLRRTNSIDEYGDNAFTWSVEDSSLPIRITTNREDTASETMSENGISVYGTHLAFIQPSQDVRVGDLLLSDGQYYTVKFIDKLPGGVGHHIELILEAVEPQVDYVYS